MENSKLAGQLGQHSNTFLTVSLLAAALFLVIVALSNNIPPLAKAVVLAWVVLP